MGPTNDREQRWAPEQRVRTTIRSPTTREPTEEERGRPIMLLSSGSLRRSLGVAVGDHALWPERNRHRMARKGPVAHSSRHSRHAAPVRTPLPAACVSIDCVQRPWAALCDLLWTPLGRTFAFHAGIVLGVCGVAASLCCAGLALDSYLSDWYAGYGGALFSSEHLRPLLQRHPVPESSLLSIRFDRVLSGSVIAPNQTVSIWLNGEMLRVNASLSEADRQGGGGKDTPCVQIVLSIATMSDLLVGTAVGQRKELLVALPLTVALPAVLTLRLADHFELPQLSSSLALTASAVHGVCIQQESGSLVLSGASAANESSADSAVVFLLNPRTDIRSPPSEDVHSTSAQSPVGPADDPPPRAHWVGELVRIAQPQRDAVIPSAQPDVEVVIYLHPILKVAATLHELHFVVIVDETRYDVSTEALSQLPPPGVDFANGLHGEARTLLSHLQRSLSGGGDEAASAELAAVVNQMDSSSHAADAISLNLAGFGSGVHTVAVDVRLGAVPFGKAAVRILHL